MKPHEITPDVAIGVNRLLEIVGKYFNLLIILFVFFCKDICLNQQICYCFLGFITCVDIIYDNYRRRPLIPTPVLWPGEFHGLYCPWGRKSQT